MRNYRDYFLSTQPKAEPMQYRITLSVETTGEPFMYHLTANYSEVAALIKRYSRHQGVTVDLTKEDYAHA